MRGWIRVGVIGAAAVVACNFSPHPAVTIDGPVGTIDAAVDAYIPNPDAGECVAASAQCEPDGQTLRTCAMAGGSAVDTFCPWGCIGNDAHCAVLQPSGGVATGSDTIDPNQLLGSGVTLQNNAVIDQTTGKITDSTGTVRAAGTGIVNGIDFESRAGGAVFRFSSLEITGALAFKDPGPAVVLIAMTTLGVDGPVELVGGCAGGQAGPGGFAGAPGSTSASGSGGGAAGTGTTFGGGGGGDGASGGSGGYKTGTPPAGGTSFGGDAIATLVGGGGGGGGNGGNPFGGGGGGALQLIANTSMSIGSNGSIDAGGCGGTSGTTDTDSGGGGGAGGTILLEAHVLTISGQLAVNGGGGGGNFYDPADPADCGTTTAAGANGALGRTPAIGGVGCAANGGLGGASTALPGVVGGNGPYKMMGDYSGGGGGGAGRMRFNTTSGSANVTDLTRLSPAPTDTPTTCTQGVAVTQ